MPKRSTDADYVHKTYRAIEQIADRVLAGKTPRERYVLAKRALYAISPEEETKPHDRNSP